MLGFQSVIFYWTTFYPRKTTEVDCMLVFLLFICFLAFGLTSKTTIPKLDF